MIQNHCIHLGHFQRSHKNIALKINYSAKQNRKCLGNIVKPCSMSLAIKEIHDKTTLRLHLTPFSMAIIKNSNNKGWSGCECVCWGGDPFTLWVGA